VLVSDASEYDACINIFKTRILLARKIFSFAGFGPRKKIF